MEQYLLHFSLSDRDIILLSLYVVSFLFQILFFFVFFRRVAYLKKAEKKADNFPPVSIVVPARSSGTFLEKNLPAILEQDYPDFEVVVVDNCSYDYTPEVLTQLKRRYSNLRTTFIPSETFFSWKLSLMLGAKAAKNEWLVFIDPFTIVPGRDWLKTMAANFTDQTDVVLGYGNNNAEGGYWSSRMRLERFIRSVYCFSFTLAGLPTFLEGRNVAYRRTLFFKNKTFSGLLNRDYAENELMLRRIMKPKRVKIELSSSAVVHFEEEITKRDYRDFLMKNRLLWRDLGFSRRILFFLEMFSRIMFYGLFLAMAVFPYFLVLVVPIFLVRLIFQVLIMKKMRKVLAEQKLFLSLLMSDFFYPLFCFFKYLGGRFVKRRHIWKK